MRILSVLLIFTLTTSAASAFRATLAFTKNACQNHLSSPGTSCSTGGVYLGYFDEKRVMVAPSGCSGATSCAGNDNYQVSQSAATTFCANLRIGSYQDWVVPSITEMQAMRDYYAELGGGFVGAPYWTSTPGSGGKYKTMTTSGVQEDSVSTANYVRCVRRY